MGNQGYVKLHRKILENPVVCKDAEYFSVWCYLLLNATHTEHDVMFDNERITLKKGQLITGRQIIAKQFNLTESKVQRVLKKLEIEQQIEQQTSTKNRLITVINWDDYQASEQQSEQQVNNKRTTSEQQVNTNKNVKNGKNVKNERNNTFVVPSIEDIEEYCKERKNNVNAESFIDYYEARGWMLGNSKMKNWKAAVRTWEKNNSEGINRNKLNGMLGG